MKSLQKICTRWEDARVAEDWMKKEFADVKVYSRNVRFVGKVLSFCLDKGISPVKVIYWRDTDQLHAEEVQESYKYHELLNSLQLIRSKGVNSTELGLKSFFELNLLIKLWEEYIEQQLSQN